MNIEIGRNRTDDKYFLVGIRVYANPQQTDLYDIVVVINSPIVGQMSKLLEVSPMTAQEACETVIKLHESFGGDMGIYIDSGIDLAGLSYK